MPTGIEWTEETWNPATGCSAVSPGCRNCYAARMARRLDGRGVGYDGTTRPRGSRLGAASMWTGRVNWLPERLEVPLRWRKPRTVFVCSMADLFHEELELGRIAAVFGVMAATPRHTYQVLTKRASRMADFFGWLELQSERTRKTVPQLLAEHTATELGQMVPMATEWPLSNVWLGVSIEDQRRLEERLPYLMDTPAAVRFLSCEPLLGPLDCHNETNAGGEDYDWLTGENYQWRDGSPERLPLRPSLDWIIAGGESGAGARPSHPAWFRKLRDDATEAGVAFFFKQWGAWAPRRPAILTTAIEERIITDAGGGDVLMRCVGKTKAGRELDGRTWEEMPATMDDTVNEEEDKDGKT